MIEHTVTFRLKHVIGSAEESDFMSVARELTQIPGVKDFQIRRQTSPHLAHDYGISMFFDTREEFEAYNAHPFHQSFVQTRWLQEVTSFQEADFEELM